MDIDDTIYDLHTDVCEYDHDLNGANGLVLNDLQKMCRKCRGVANRSYMSEWTNARGQVFVFVPDHPYSRKDGFYARARLVYEEKMGRILQPEERVYHADENPSNDDPENLLWFANQHALAQHRSKRYQERKAKADHPWGALTPRQRAWQEERKKEREVRERGRKQDEARERSIAALRAANEKRRSGGRG